MVFLSLLDAVQIHQDDDCGDGNESQGRGRWEWNRTERYKVYKAGQGSKVVATCSVRFEATPSLSSERILWDAQEPSLKLPTPSVSLCSHGPAEISA